MKKHLVNALIYGLVAFVAVGAGVAVPVYFLNGSEGAGGAAAAKAEEAPLAVLPFDSVAVNLTSDRLTRYLRVKVLLVVPEKEEPQVKELTAKKQAFLKSWLISYLSDQTVPDVTGATGVNRVRREIQDRFNAMLFPDGQAKIHDVLFEEFLIQ